MQSPLIPCIKHNMATPAPQEPFAEINAACHCGQLAASVEVATASLPLGLYLCACDTCRHNSGHLAITAALLPSNKRNFQVKGKAEKYATSEGPDGPFRCFCGACGASVYEDSPNEEKICPCGGALTKAEGLVAAKCHIFVGDTKDGGYGIGFRKSRRGKDGTLCQSDKTRLHPLGTTIRELRWPNPAR